MSVRQNLFVHKIAALLLVLVLSFQDSCASGVDTTANNEDAVKHRRVLKRIQGFGGKPDPSRFPLQECQGDCDVDSDCAAGLTCFQKGVMTAVPGCEGGETDRSKTDYCIKDPNSNPRPTQAPLTPRPTEVPQSTPKPTSKPANIDRVHYLGNDGWPASVFPLPVCGGDCDKDTDCQGSSICFQRTRFDAVPGCLGGERDSSRTDYCIRSPDGPQPTTPRPTTAPQITHRPTTAPQMTPGPTSKPTNRPTQAPQLPPTATRMIEYIGNNGSPPSSFPLGLCQGDCDSNSDCQDGLECFQRNRYQAVPGCLGGQGDSSQTDYCIPPPGGPTPTPLPVPGPVTPRPTQALPQPTAIKQVEHVGNDGSPSSAYPLGECQGDCDHDDECDWGLYCFQRSRYDAVPGCLGGASDSSSSDYCAPLSPDQQPVPGTFRLKMYWEQGYFWQEETRERKWCVTFNYDGYPGTGKCWYGLETMACNPEEMYISKCGNDKRQRLLFVGLTGGEFLVKLGNGENKCWERSRRAIYLRTCSSTNPLQRWYNPNGNINGGRFEISQKGFDSQCVSTAHHPKAGEVVELHSCVALRKPDSETSYWHKY